MVSGNEIPNIKASTKKKKDKTKSGEIRTMD